MTPHNICVPLQALKANPDRCPGEFKMASNYITNQGRIAITEALDMVYEMSGGRQIVITY